MEPALIHVRIKREKRTYFFECTLLDTVELLKKRLQNFYKQESTEMRLFYGTRVFLYITLSNSCWMIRPTCLIRM